MGRRELFREVWTSMTACVRLLSSNPPAAPLFAMRCILPRTLTLVGLLVVPALVGAQTTEEEVTPLPVVVPLPPADLDPDIIDLPDFIVAAPDRVGYLQTNSNTGSRLNQNAKELPIPLEIITPAFIEDTGALELKEALAFSAGLETELTNVQQGENASQETSFRLRGKVAEAALRNGFKRIGQADTFNISQVDVARGPNALLYGIGNFGGVVNYLTERTLAETRQRGSFSMGSEGFWRADLSSTGPVTKNKKIRYRLGAYMQEEDQWFEFGAIERQGIAGVLEFDLTKNTNLMVEYEVLTRRTQQTENPYSSAYRVGGLRPYTDSSFYPNDGVRSILIQPYPEFRWSGSDAWKEDEDTGFLVELVHKFSPRLQGYAGWYHSSSKDTAQNLSLGVGNASGIQLGTDIRSRAEYPWLYNPADPNFDAWYSPYGDVLSYNWSQVESEQLRDQFRVDLTYSFEVFKQRNILLVGYTYNVFSLVSRSTPLRDTSRPNTGSNPYIVYSPAFARLQSIFNYDPIRFDPSPTERFLAYGDTPRSEFWEQGYYLIHQGFFFDERIRTILGLRYDWIQTGRSTLDTTTGIAGPVQKRASGPSTDFNPSLAISWSPRKNGPFAIYVLAASALQPIYNQTLSDGFVPDPSKGDSFEVGLKFDLFKDDRGVPRVSGAAAIYHLETVGTVVDQGGGPYSGAELGLTSASLDPNWVAQGRSGSSGNGLRDDLSRGLDLQVIFTDLGVRNLQTVLNFSYNDYQEQRFYGLQYDAANSDPANGVYNFIEVDSAPSTTRRNNDSPEFSARLWSKYEFKEGFLRGFDIGFGARWTDKREAQYGASEAQTYKIIPARSIFDAAFGYKTKIFRRDVNFRANFNNLADDREVYGYNVPSPFSWRISARVNF